MKTLKGLSLTALLLVGSFSFVAPTQANTEVPTQATETTLTAPTVDLSYDTTTITTTQAPAPLPEPTPALPPAPVEEQPTTDPVEPAPTTVEEQPTAAPTEDNLDSYPAPPPVIPATPTAPTANDSNPDAGATCLEDEPCWDCNTMGNRICGKGEAIALSGYPDLDTFNARYIGVFKVGLQREGYRYVQSVVSPEYSYVFIMTVAETCAITPRDTPWFDQWCPKGDAPATPPNQQ